MIRLEHISKTYISRHGLSVQALTDIQLEVHPGEIYGVIGHSGAGKSTLIRCINLLERPSAGQVWVDNQNLTQFSSRDLRQARHHIGMIFQHFNLLSSRTVYENIALPLQLAGESKKLIEKKVLPLLGLTHLTEKAKSYPAELSGGQKQRVAIARALANQPKVLLCDEATSSLDPKTTRSILELLKNINRELGVTILLITHEMAVIKQLCDRVGVLHDSKLIESHPILEFFQHPKTTIGQQFVDASLQQELPHAIANRLLPKPTDSNCLPVIRIYFIGASAQEPVISRLLEKFPIKINILQANIEVIKETPIGVMVVEVSGESADIDKSLEALKAQQLRVELIGYVKRNATSP